MTSIYQKLKKGNLVKVFGQPECKTKIDLDCLGVFEKTEGNFVIISWPNLGMLRFKRLMVESID